MIKGEPLRVRDYLEHIQHATGRIARYVTSLDRTTFLANE